MRSTLFAATAALVASAQAGYVLDTVMWGGNFFSNFNFATTDPNNGYVQYLSQSAAQSAGLIFQGEGAAARISADAKTTLSGVAGTAGRQSVRIESKKTWTHGLYVYYLAAAPVQACGSWPAIWHLGSGAAWPANGEIDVYEGISLQTQNLYTMHTSSGCTFTKQTETGTFKQGDCYGGDNNNQGCGVSAANTNSYGTGLNSAQGGMYVMEWTSTFIKFWWYPKSAGLPADLTNGAPDQTKRGTPDAYFLGGSGCTIDNKFKNMQIILNLDFCGSWAGSVWSTTTGCSSKASTCEAYVGKNPTAFNNVKFEINSIKVYQQSTSKRGIEDPSLEWERSLLNVTDTVEEIEIRSVTEETIVKPAHLHRHRHWSERLHL